MNVVTNEGDEWMNRWMRWGTAAEEEEEVVVKVKEEAQTNTAHDNTRLVHAGSEGSTGTCTCGHGTGAALKSTSLNSC